MNPDLADRFGLSPVSEIIPGRLWQGMRPTSYIGYDLVVSCEWFLAKKPMLDYEGVTIHCPLRDEDDFDLRKAASLIWIAASGVAFALNDDSRASKTLIHCSGGLNRSSLVTIRALEIAHDWTPKEALTVLRAKHDPYVLCNRQFERWVLREQLPTAETTTLR